MFSSIARIGFGVALLGLPRLAAATPVVFFGEDLSSSKTLSTTPIATSARNAFFANLNGVATETFEGITSNPLVPLVVNFGVAGTATLAGTGSVRSGATPGNQYAISGTRFYNTDTTLQLTFNAPISAFGFYATDLGDAGAPLTLILTGSNGVTTLAVPNVVNSVTADGSALYYGFYDTANTYTAISFTSAALDAFGLDDLSVGSRQQVAPVSSTPVPEPAALALLGTGLLCIGVVRRIYHKDGVRLPAAQPADDQTEPPR